LPAFTPRTITSRAALAREVERASRRGYADAVGEREEDLSAVAAPVFDVAGVLAAILGVQGPSPRFDRSAREAALPALRAHTRELSRALGFVDERASGRSERRSAPAARRRR
jgi:IclR family acetate operon transcriptional repressor